MAVRVWLPIQLPGRLFSSSAEPYLCNAGVTWSKVRNIDILYNLLFITCIIGL